MGTADAHRPLRVGVGEDDGLRGGTRHGERVERTSPAAVAAEVNRLRTLAELVARGAVPEEVFVAVTTEASALLGDLPMALMIYDDSGARVVATADETRQGELPAGPGRGPEPAGGRVPGRR